MQTTSPKAGERAEFAEFIREEMPSMPEADVLRCAERASHLRTIVRTHTAFDSMDELLNARGNYRPSIGVSHRGKRGAELLILADAYDAAQKERGDNRRAFRF